MGGEITYACIGSNQYTVTLTLYRDCSGIPLSSLQTIIITNSCGFSSPSSLSVNLAGNPQQISPICATGLSTCNGGTVFGLERYVFEGTVTLPGGCSDWTFSNTVVNRNLSITTTANGGNDSLFIYSLINNTTAICDTSPEFFGSAVGFFYVGSPSCFYQSVYDAEGDSLTFQLTTPRTGPVPSDTVHYLSGYSYTQPITSSPLMTFDSSTGEFCFTSTQIENSVFAVIVSEFRNGILIGQVERDIQLRTEVDPLPPNIVPTLSGINGSTLLNMDACPGVPINFFIAAYDSNTTEDLYQSWDNGIASATWTYNSSIASNADTAFFSWTPTVFDISSTPYCFNSSVFDSHCPNSGFQTHQFCITVLPLTDPFCINPGIQEMDAALNFHLYPNPAHDELNLLYEKQETQLTFLAIYNSTGQNVYSEMISSFEKINVSSWPRGLYTIVINAGNKVTAKRVVIQ